MQAYVYKSRRKSDTYVYLREREGFGLIPEPVLASLGALEFVLEVALGPDRKLARADARVVQANLVAQGFHLQFPALPEGALPATGIEYPSDMAVLNTAFERTRDEPMTGSSLRDGSLEGDASHGHA